ncbi:MAG: hypothetical protein WAO74_11550 [Polaribacter sp.]|uniref:hypothetical protein n=1 Tax=Polaribacter sp. TaxID=1920175 RepID=UPI003BB0EA0F
MNKFKIIIFLLVGINVYGQGTVEAEFDTIFKYQFEPLKVKHNKRILIDASHNTIYSLSYGKETAREMLRIMDVDGYEIQFTEQVLDSVTLSSDNTDLLIIHGMPNDKIILGEGSNKEILYKSPLKDNETINIGKFVYNGGSLLLFLSHFPGGSGAQPILESFNVKFRDGYAYHPNHSGHKGSLCSQFNMTKENNLLNTNHPIIKSAKSTKLIPKNVKFLCGAAIFRNPEDNILPFPNNSINYTPTSDGKSNDVEESSDSYSGMIGFNFGKGRVVICTDQGIFRSLDLLIDDEKIPVTIHDPNCENAALFVNTIRWLTKMQ